MSGRQCEAGVLQVLLVQWYQDLGSADGLLGKELTRRSQMEYPLRPSTMCKEPVCPAPLAVSRRANESGEKASTYATGAGRDGR